MNKFLNFSIVLLMSIFILQSCSKNGGKGADILSHIPSNAILVATMDMDKILTKSNWSTLYQELEKHNLTQDTPAEVKALFANPSETGLNFKATWASATIYKKEEVISFFIMPVEDAAKLEALITKNASKESKQNYSVVQLEKNTLIAWNKNTAILAFTTDGLSTSVDLQLVDVFNKPKSNIQSVPNFKKFFVNNKDMVIWACNDSLIAEVLNDPATGGQVKMFLPMISLTEAALYNNVWVSSADFENGKANFDMQYQFSEELRNKFGGIFNDKLSKNYAQYLEGDNIIASNTLSINLVEVDKVLQSYKNVPVVGSMLSGVLQSPIYQNYMLAFNGDIIATYQAASKEALKNNEAHFTVLVGLNKAENLTSLLELIIEGNELTKVGENEYSIKTIEGYTNVTFFYNKDVLVISSNPAAIAAVKSGKASNAIDSKTYANFNNGYMTFWANSLGMQAPSLISQANHLVDEDFNFFDNTVESVSSYAKASNGKMEIILSDKSKNSLEILIRELIKIGVEAQKRMQENSFDYEEENELFHETYEDEEVTKEVPF